MEKSRKHIATQLRRNFHSTTQDQLRNATEKMTEIDRSLMNIPLSESAAVEIGLSVRQSAEDIVKEKELDAEILCHIIFDSVRFHGIAQAVEVFKQMRGQAERNRQVKFDVERALTHNVGGNGATAIVHIYEK